MYVYAHDKFSGSIVAALTPVPTLNADADNEQLIQSILQQQHGAVPTSWGAFILITDAQYPNPDARWRKRYAELRNEIRFSEFFFILVTSARILRGVMTAVNWINPPSPRFQTEAFGTFEEAARWLEDKRKQKLPMLYKLRDEVQSKLGKGQTAARA